MKSLFSILQESISDETKKVLLDIINSPSFTEKQARKIIRSLDDQKILVDTLYNYYTSRGVEDDAKNITRIIDANDNIEEFIELVSNDSYLPSADDFIKGHNIYDLFSSCNLNKETLKELANEKPSRSSITRGMFEILCELLLKNINYKNANYPGKAGDVNAGGLAIEFKGPQARVKGQKEHNALLIDQKFNELYNTISDKEISDKNIFSTQDLMKKYLGDLSASDEDIFNVISKSLLNQYGFDDDLRSIQKEIVNKGKIDVKNITRLLGCIQLKGYYLDERWDYICIFHGNKGIEALQRGDYTCILGEDVTDIVKTFNNKHLIFSGGGKYTGSVRDHYCQIYYK